MKRRKIVFGFLAVIIAIFCVSCSVNNSTSDTFNGEGDIEYSSSESDSSLESDSSSESDWTLIF